MKSFLRRLCEVSSTDSVERLLADVSWGVKAKSLLTVAWSGWCLRTFRRVDGMHSFACRGQSHSPVDYFAAKWCAFHDVFNWARLAVIVS